MPEDTLFEIPETLSPEERWKLLCAERGVTIRDAIEGDPGLAEAVIVLDGDEIVGPSRGNATDAIHALHAYLQDARDVRPPFPTYDTFRIDERLRASRD